MSKFLSYEDRIIIAQRLQENAFFGAIGKEMGKNWERTVQMGFSACYLPWRISF